MNYPPELKDHFGRIDHLVSDIGTLVPHQGKGVIDFRADLAGMLVVSIVAMYETCVKSSMVSYASNYGKEFELFTERHFDKLSSRITHKDLRRYANTFDNKICVNFDDILDRRRKLAVKLSGRNPIKQLDAMLGWRHDFAHAGKRQTTIEEAIYTHRLSSIVILSFHKAFHSK